ncbi:DNA damage-binding protein 1-like isoform X2 [Diospyros lotus]|uniref:DNA damage-binding protein 1-like isoform X2 n=1 Tax=Diospyros lotus TaxID=55363 RepID=UPI00224EEE50|nr:DNA damage-binding protein 1-like isoform X2 [Diospyros lotus]
MQFPVDLNLLMYRIIFIMWSLRRATDDLYDAFLVVSFISETRILEMNANDELEETEIDGICSQVQTLFCHDAVYNQLVQVTSSSVRLVSSTSKMLRDEWTAPSGYSVNVATANATQVLLATGGGHLVYLEIGDGILAEVKHAQLEYDISCLDINPIGENPNFSQLAAVGMWTDISVRIFSLPDLNLITKESVGGEIIPRSVLLCSFEGISYLLCALGDGHLLNFLLNMSTGELTDRKKISLGTQPITLHTFSSKNTTHVFAASDRPTVIYSSNKKLLYNNVNLKEVSHMCPFNSSAFPDSLAIAKEGELTIGTIDDIQKLHIRCCYLDLGPPILSSSPWLECIQSSIFVCLVKLSPTQLHDLLLCFSFSVAQFKYLSVAGTASFLDCTQAHILQSHSSRRSQRRASSGRSIKVSKPNVLDVPMMIDQFPFSVCRHWFCFCC